MRRTLLATLAAAALLALGGPATALAKHGHHQRSHRHHVRRLSHKRFGRAAAPAGQDTAGTVASFTDGVLTITLNDGSTVSGRVTDATEIECQAAENDNNDVNDNNDSRSSSADDNGGDNGGDNGDDNGADNENGSTCAMSDLTQGATVQEADLRISSAGAAWQKLDLAG